MGGTERARLDTFRGLVKFLPKHPYYRPQKIEEIAEKKVVRNFLTNLKIFNFLEFFSENVLKTLLRGRETTRKKYRIVFEKFKFFYFFRLILRKCLKKSSKGTRNN